MNGLDRRFAFRSATLLLVAGQAAAQVNPSTDPASAAPGSLRRAQERTQYEPAPAQAAPNWGAPSANPPSSAIAASPAAQAPSSLPNRTVSPDKPSAWGSTTGKPKRSPAATTASPSKGTARDALTRLLQQPDNAAATINGKSLTAGQIRNQLSAYAAARGKPRARVAVRNVTAPGSSASALQTQNRALIAALSQDMRGVSAQLQPTAIQAPRTRVVGGPSLFEQQTSVAAAQGAPCPSRPPGLGSVQGTLQPGGVVVLRGLCFGDAQGKVRMYGAFPGAYVLLQVNLWTDGGVAATVPADLTGVVDQTARLQLVRSDSRASNQRNAGFVARRETVQLPASLVQTTSCGNLAGDCKPGGVSHFALRFDDDGTMVGEFKDTDTYQIRLGNGWAINTLDLANAVGDFAVSGFDQGPPDYVAFKIQWSVASTGSSHANDQLFGLINGVSYNNMDYYLAAYTPVVTATGPVAVSPDPAVKPPFTEHQGKPTTGAAGSLTARLPDGGGAVAPAPGTPNWNLPPAAARPAASTRVSGALRPVQMPGQSTTPAPGAPVESPR